MIHTTETSEPRKRNLAPAAIGLSLAAIVLSATVLGLTLAGSLAPAAPAPTTREVRIIISSIAPHNETPMLMTMMEEMHVYTPSTLVVNRGDTIRLTIVNMDEHRHGFRIPDLNVQTNNALDEVAPGEEIVLTFTADRSGVFVWECNVPYQPAVGMMEQECGEDHDQMQGYLVVR